MHAFHSPMLGRPRCDWSGFVAVVVVAVSVFGLALATSPRSGAKGQLGWPDPLLWLSRTSLKTSHLRGMLGYGIGCGSAGRIGGSVDTGGHWQICAESAVVSFVAVEAIAAGSVADGNRSVLGSTEAVGEVI